ncbi:MAG: isochorismatase, partial [Alphaproteobacteria bacterium]|nr:isochorismatase [Alphaproteobacteria bacterium]
YMKGAARPTICQKKEAAASLGLTVTASHLQELTHHMGLYFMAARGARIVSEVEVAI